MKTLKTVAAIGAALFASSAIAQYSDHALLFGESWGPDAQRYAGQSAAEYNRDQDRSAERDARTASEGSSVQTREQRETRDQGFAKRKLRGYAGEQANSAIWGVGS